MNPIPKALEGSRSDIDFKRTFEGEESNLKENPLGGTKSINPKAHEIITTKTGYYHFTIRFLTKRRVRPALRNEMSRLVVCEGAL